MSIRHSVPSGLPAGTTSGKVAGDDWRNDHLHIPFAVPLFQTATNTALALTASAAADTEILGTSHSCRAIVDLSQARSVRLTGMCTVISTTATSTIKLVGIAKASEAATWPTASDTDSGAALNVGSTGGAILLTRDTGWQTLAAGMQIDNCSINLLVGSAFGTTAPSISNITAWFK